MEYQEYLTRLEAATRLHDGGKFTEAVEAFYQLFLSEVSDLDKASLCVNLALAYDRLGKTDEALAWYDKGIAFEQLYSRYAITEKKVQYLTNLGRAKEGVPIFEALLKQPYLTEAEKLRIRKALQVLLGRTMAEWK